MSDDTNGLSPDLQNFSSETWLHATVNPRLGETRMNYTELNELIREILLWFFVGNVVLILNLLVL